MGLVLFLLGMSQLESGIRLMGYETFKRWLSRSTASAAGSAGIGVLTTAILQSSSMVSLLVLAFASAGALPLYNAIGVIIGANLGTTMTGWMVATIGFKISLQLFALPLMAGGGLMQLLAARFSVLRAPGIALFGLGLIIFGLDMMKDAVAGLPQQWSLGVLKGHGLWLYFITGAVITALIQSSSATMMIILTAVHVGLLELDGAAALVIGADFGTSSTTALGSIGGHYIKRQLALAQVLFNFVIDMIAFFILLPLLPVMLAAISLQDPLYSLVAFHSLFNFLGLLLFLPLLKPFAHWIGQRFVTPEEVERALVGQPTAVPEAALVATAGVLANMRLNSTTLNMHAFHLRPEQLQLPGQLHQDLDECFENRITAEQRYAALKEQESDLLAFSFDLQEQPLNSEQATLLEHQTREARALVYSSKTLNDIRENLVNLRHSKYADIENWYMEHRNFIKVMYRHYLLLAHDNSTQASAREKLARLFKDNENHYLRAHEAVNDMASHDLVSGIDLSTMLNVNREIHHSLKNLLLSLE